MTNHQRIDKLSSVTTINNQKLIKLTNDVSDVQASIEGSQQLIEEKSKKIEERTDKEKQKKLDRVREYDNESLKDTEEVQRISCLKI